MHSIRFHLLLGEARINHKHHSVNSQRSLSDVCRNDHLSANGSIRLVGGSGLEYPLLKVRGEGGIEGDAFERPHVWSKILNLSLKSLASFFNFLKLDTINY